MLQSALCKRNLLVLLPVVLLMGTVFAEDRPPDGQETPSTSDATAALQKATQNPIASLISVPIQNTSNFGIGPNDRTQDVLNIQPVVPLRVSKDWNLIVRWIIPVIWQPAPGTQNLRVFGIEEKHTRVLGGPIRNKASGSIWLWRYAANVLLIAGQTGQADLGRRAVLYSSHSHQ